MLRTDALRIKARDIVMAGLNARGLQSKLLITPLSSEAIIIYNNNNNNFKDSEARVAYKSQHLKRVIHKYSY